MRLSRRDALLGTVAAVVAPKLEIIDITHLTDNSAFTELREWFNEHTHPTDYSWATAKGYFRLPHDSKPIRIGSAQVGHGE